MTHIERCFVKRVDDGMIVYKELFEILCNHIDL